MSVFKPKFRILMIKKTGMIIRPRSAPRPIILVLALGVFIAVAAAILTGSNLIAVVMAQNSVVDIRLSPASSTVGQGATTTIDILVEPNGQETTGVQVFIDFTPSHLQVSQIITDPNSPLDVVIQAPDFDNSAGTIGLSYGTFATGPTTSFTLAIITFVSKVVDLDTKVAFSTVSPRKTIASIEGSEIQDELAGSTISILAGVSLTGQVLPPGRKQDRFGLAGAGDGHSVRSWCGPSWRHPDTHLHNDNEQSRKRGRVLCPRRTPQDLRHRRKFRTHPHEHQTGCRGIGPWNCRGPRHSS